ncbi:hypothetical protein ISF_01890 [Cordyceps fumosorosea ARSEF 2679]|uniref:Uncharacterized protein n=1 Tax=Cordyceps fumosorosea (strain ARSEF 2679) TaxID=1081104 RepID=A0A162MVS5_CORFA|nr:hypothetical protein ISF_01890 [Cordyceps fumosorosea ARSEF 2679]OAA71339.1 hypothetical protein ISF_01890 [Cordyceps fumosorosea ARSEF 2679]
MSDDQGYRSSQEYTGAIVEVDAIAVSTKQVELMAAISSGEMSKNRRAKLAQQKTAKAEPAQAQPAQAQPAQAEPAFEFGGDPAVLAAVLSSGSKAKGRRQEDANRKARVGTAVSGSGGEPAKTSGQDHASKNLQANEGGFF